MVPEAAGKIASILPKVQFFLDTNLTPDWWIFSKQGSRCKMGRYLPKTCVIWSNCMLQGVVKVSILLPRLIILVVEKRYCCLFLLRAMFLAQWTICLEYPTLKNLCSIVSNSMSSVVWLAHVLFTFINSPIGKVRLLCDGWQLSVRNRVFPNVGLRYKIVHYCWSYTK